MVWGRRGQRQQKSFSKGEESPFKGEQCLCFSASASMEHCPPKMQTEQPQPRHCGGDMVKQELATAQTAQLLQALLLLFHKPRQGSRSEKGRTRYSREETATVGAEGAEEDAEGIGIVAASATGRAVTS